MTFSMEYIFTFNTTNIAIKAENTLLERNIEVTVMPLPSAIRAGCGISLKVESHMIGHVIEIFSQTGITEFDIYCKTIQNNQINYKKTENISVVMNEKLTSLLENCSTGGCGAKISPGELSRLLSNLPIHYDENLIVGYDTSDDAGVYKVDSKISLVTTADFFPPMVNDPKTFGRIAAANALSDVYAMGGRPVTALNLVCFPQSMNINILEQILIGGAEKVAEASCALAGGHSIYDKEPKYGLAVTGVVENDKIIRNNTPNPGDALILTKPLGTGLVLAALRGGAASESAVTDVVASMERLNKYAAEKFADFDISACTDVTGFGLLAHALEMASDKVSILLFPDNIPFFPDAYAYAEEFLITAAGQRNRNHLAGKANVDSLPFPLQELIFDPQTSGGLLLSIHSDQAQELLSQIQKDDPHARIIGRIVDRSDDVILFA